MEGSVLSGVVQVLSLVRDLGKAGYNAKAGWEDFFRKVSLLQDQREAWEELETRYGPALFGNLTASAKTAVKMLEKEKEKADVRKHMKEKHRIRYSTTKYLSIAKKAIFSADTEEAINRVKEAFADVIKNLEEKEKTSNLVQWCILQGKPPLDFVHSKLYVRLEKTSRDVEESLCSAENKVVLLHGGAGTGKSSLARDLVLQIKSRAKRDGNHPLSRSSSDYNAQEAMSILRVHPSASNEALQLQETFHDAAFLNCGPAGELKCLMRDLLKKLGWQKIQDTLDEDLSTALVHTLQDKKLLIVLDDVWNAQVQLLQYMLMWADEATNVKYLVTSQDPDLCGQLERCIYKKIGMEKISIEVAREIFLRHIFDPYPEHQSSFQGLLHDPRIEECVNDISEVVDRNIFALACVGGAARFDDQNFKDLRSWRYLEDELHDYLYCSEKSQLVQGVKYPHPNYYAAAEYSLKRLSYDEKRLLFLLSWCEEHYVPERIVQYLFRLSGSGSGRQAPWSKSKQALLERGLFQIDGGLCLMHSLLRTSLELASQDNFKTTFADCLAHNDYVQTVVNEKLFASTVCMLFFKDKDFASNVAAKMKKPTPILDELSKFNKIVATAAIGEEPDCSPKEQSAWRKVLLSEAYYPFGSTDKVFIHMDTCILHSASSLCCASLIKATQILGHFARIDMVWAEAIISWLFGSSFGYWTMFFTLALYFNFHLYVWPRSWRRCYKNLHRGLFSPRYYSVAIYIYSVYYAVRYVDTVRFIYNDRQMSFEQPSLKQTAVVALQVCLLVGGFYYSWIALRSQLRERSWQNNAYSYLFIRKEADALTEKGKFYNDLVMELLPFSKDVDQLCDRHSERLSLNPLKPCSELLTETLCLLRWMYSRLSCRARGPNV